MFSLNLVQTDLVLLHDSVTKMQTDMLVLGPVILKTGQGVSQLTDLRNRLDTAKKLLEQLLSQVNSQLGSKIKFDE